MDIFKKFGTASLAVLLGVCLASCDDEEELQDLTVDAASVELTEGDSAVVSILTGNGQYTVESGNSAVATAALQGKSVVIKGVAEGQASVEIEDVKSNEVVTISVTVSDYLLSLQYADVERWFAGETPSDAARAKQGDDVVNGIETTAAYSITLGDIASTLSATTLREANWDYMAAPVDGASSVAFFKAGAKELLESADYEYYVGQVWPIAESTDNRTSVSEADAAATVEATDYSTSNMRIGFKRGDDVAVIQIEDGKAAFQVHTAVWADNWKWYAENFLDGDFPTLYVDNYMWVASYGMIPPRYQLMIFSGQDRKSNSFKLTMMAPLYASTSTIQEIDASFADLNSDNAAAMAVWQEIMNSGELGTFEQAFVYPLSSSDDVTTLTSTDGAIEYVTSHDVSEYSYITPIFRVSSDRVVIPKFNKSGLTMIMAILEAE